MNSCDSPLTVVGRGIASGGNGNGITTIVVPDAFCPPWVIRLICSINPLKCRRSFSARFKSSGGCRWSILITVPLMAGHICLCPILDHLPPPSANAYCIPKKAHQHRVSYVRVGEVEDSFVVFLIVISRKLESYELQLCASPIV